MSSSHCRKQVSPLSTQFIITDVAHQSLWANNRRRYQNCRVPRMFANLLHTVYQCLRQWLGVMEAEGSRLTGAQTYRLLLSLGGRRRSIMEFRLPPFVTFHVRTSTHKCSILPVSQFLSQVLIFPKVCNGENCSCIWLDRNSFHLHLHNWQKESVCDDTVPVK